MRERSTRQLGTKGRGGGVNSINTSACRRYQQRGVWEKFGVGVGGSSIIFNISRESVSGAEVTFNVGFT